MKIRILGGSLAIAAAVGLVTAPACKKQVDPLRDDPNTPWRESRLSLQAAASCDAVRAHLVDVVTENVLRNRYYPLPPLAAGAAEDSASSGSDRSPTDYTRTNVQEAGVDEDDLVKTDGTHLYTVHGDELLILKSWPANETSIVSRVSLGTNASGSSLFLKDDRVVVFSWIYETGENGEGGKVVTRPFYGTRLTFVDVTDRTAPRILGHREVEGWMSAARMIGSQVHLVTNGSVDLPSDVWQALYEASGNPSYDADAAEAERRIAAERPRIRAEVERALALLDVTSILPRTRTFDAAGAPLDPPSSIVGCTDLYLPAESSTLGLLEVSSFDLAAERPWEMSTTGVLASGWQVYASTENLYVAMSSRWWWWGFGTQDNVSHIHKFALGGAGGPKYVGSGEVDGWILNQFSMSEYQGNLRVATTDNEWTWNEAAQRSDVTGGNHVTVLKEIDGALQPIGAIRDLSPGEQIYAARMMGPKGYVVTFRQTDPLFTLDLSDPTNPGVVGELKVNGFSSYLHPIGDDYLLAIGQDADAQGRVLGIQLQIFDVRDPANPTRPFQQRISTGTWSSWSEAMWDHHAFTYHPEKKILAFPASIYDWDTRTGERFSGLLVYHASPEDGFREIGRVDHSDMASQAYCVARYGGEACPVGVEYEWWASMRRSVFIEDALYSISSVGLKVNELLHPENGLAAVEF